MNERVARHRKVVAFDLDGTLVDVSAAMRAVLGAVKHAGAQQIDIDAVMAEPRVPLRQRLQPWVAPEALPQVLSEFTAAFFDQGLALVRPLPGAAEALAAAREGDGEVVVITGWSTEIGRAVLSACGMPDLAVAGDLVGEFTAYTMVVHRVRVYVGAHRPGMVGARLADVYAVGLADTDRAADALRDAGAQCVLPHIRQFASWYQDSDTRDLLSGLRPSPRHVSRLPMSGGEDTTVRGRPEYWAARHRDLPAVVDGDTTMTYAQWDERAERVAESLSRLPVEGGGRVAVRMHARPEWFVTSLALAKLRWELVALGWRLAPSEVRKIVEQCDPRALILDDAEPDLVAAGLVGRGGRPVPAYSIGAASNGTLPFGELLSGPRVERGSRAAAAIVLYSSGTTGEPRGVRYVSPRDAKHRQQFIDSLRGPRAQQADGVNRTLLTLPLDHGAGPRATFFCHNIGGCVYLLDRFDPVRALEMIERHRITHWKTVPTMLTRLRDLPDAVSRRFDVSSLRSVSVGGAPSSPALKLWAVDFFGPVLYEGYGSTEVGMVTVMPPSMIAVKPGSCGRPRKDVELRITTADGADLPTGEPGHIRVRSAGSGVRASSESASGADYDFVDTGDIGYLDADGYLYIRGRSKDMIIVGGNNVYPVEVEQVIVELDAVLDAAVVGVPDGDMGEVVAAVCELRPGERLTADEVSRHAESRLAAYKRPRRIEFVDALPRNRMEKILKDELRALLRG